MITRLDPGRSIGLARLAPLASIEAVQLVSLQHELRDADAAVLRGLPQILHIGGELADFADKAAAVAQLDLVISSDTSVAHLAGWRLGQRGRARAPRPVAPGAPRLSRRRTTRGYGKSLARAETPRSLNCHRILNDRFGWEYGRAIAVSRRTSSMPAVLRLYEDTLSNAEDLAVGLPALPRMIFVVHGAMTIDDRTFGDGEAWHGERGAALKPGRDGVTCWRFELASQDARNGIAAGRGVRSHEKIAASLDTLPHGELLMRGDSVGFPPGGCAYMHMHQGPGIRCLLDGGIRIDADGHSTSYGPGGAWYESGPVPVFAQAAADRPSRFIRVMILPRALIGKSSIQYVNDDDRNKPKSQQYKIFVDAPIAFAGS